LKSFWTELPGLHTKVSQCFQKIVSTNTFTNPGDPWSDGEAVIRFQPGPIFSGNSSDYWAPTNWRSLVDRLLLEMQIRLGPMATGPLQGEIYQAASCSYFASALRSRRGDRSICACLARAEASNAQHLKNVSRYFSRTSSRDFRRNNKRKEIAR
jgi:hypothetical protein